MEVGSRKSHGPRLVGEVIIDFLNNSNEPLAVAYRNRFHPDTHLDVDLKLLTRQPRRISIGDSLDGVITRDGEDHFTFIQNNQVRKRKTYNKIAYFVGKNCFEFSESHR